MSDVVVLSRHITTHQSNECNAAIEISADEPSHGNASHIYRAKLPDGRLFVIDFQNGPIKEVGTNGLTHEVLLAILIDRLEGFQSGPYANAYNLHALKHVQSALDHLNDRTREREARGVEGTHEL